MTELIRQPIEQRRMRRSFTEPAEVIDRPNETLAEVPLPDTVHHHPRCQRMRRAGQPLSQLQTTASSGQCLRHIARQHARQLVRDFTSQREMTAAQMNFEVLRLHVGDGHDLEELGHRLFQLLELLSPRLQSGDDLRRKRALNVRRYRERPLRIDDQHPRRFEDRIGERRR